jgi:hypothetical protein
MLNIRRFGRTTWTKIRLKVILLGGLTLVLGVHLPTTAQVTIDWSQLQNQPPQSENKQISEAKPQPTLDSYQAPTDAYVDYFYTNVMAQAPYLPSDLEVKSSPRPSHSEIGCSNVIKADENYSSAADVQYQQVFWENRIASDWQFFSPTANAGKVLVIDYATKGSALAYRYLANAQSQQLLYEPWATSNIFAFTGAAAQARQLGLSTNSLIGDTHVGTLVTTMLAAQNGDAQNIAAYFANVAGRGYLTSLLRDEWLLLSHSQVRLKGVSSVPWRPASPVWLDLNTDTLATPFAFDNHFDDPSYQAYQCAQCGVTGNQPMTTLAQAEWLKRLASHTREPATAHPHLTQQDVNLLFNGIVDDQQNERAMRDETTAPSFPGGMLTGVSSTLHYALAEAIAGQPVNNPKRVLDRATNGQWRVWQTVGWGISDERHDDRHIGENVVLAHVCLPLPDGSREFTIAAQTAHGHNDAKAVNHAGIKMQRLLIQTLTELIRPQD